MQGDISTVCSVMTVISHATTDLYLKYLEVHIMNIKINGVCDGLFFILNMVQWQVFV